MKVRERTDARAKARQRCCTCAPWGDGGGQTPSPRFASGTVIERAAIDSWATRLGALAVVQLAASSAAKTPFHQALLHIVLLALVILTTAPVLGAFRNTMRDKVSPWSVRAWLVPAALIAAAVTPIALAFPDAIPPIVEWLLSDWNRHWISLAIALFGMGTLIKLGVCWGVHWVWRRIRVLSRR